MGSEMCIRDSLGWASGSNYIFPYKHFALEDGHFSCDGTDIFIVREKCKSLPDLVGRQQVSKSEIDVLLSGLKQWPLQYQIVVINHIELRLEVFSGSWGTAPCFLVAKDQHIDGHWKPSELYSSLSNASLDEDFVAQFLVDFNTCLLYTSPSPRDLSTSRMPSSA